MRFKQWLHEASPFDGVQFAPPPEGELPKMPEAPEYSKLGQVNFYDRKVGFTSNPIAGKMVMDQNHKLFIANVRSHEKLCGIFGISENCLVHGYYSPGGGHKIWAFHDKEDKIYGLESLEVLLETKLAKPTDTVEFLGHKTTVGDVLSNEGETKGGDVEDERNLEAKRLSFWKDVQPKKLNRTDFPDTSQGREAWFYRYPESFKQFVEDKTRSLEPHKYKKHKKHDTENYLDAIWRELGIGPESIPDKIDSGPIEIDGFVFNQAVFKVIKPITLKDHMVRIRLEDIDSPNLDQKVYRRGEDGELVPYEGPLPTHTFLISIKELADLLSRAWQSAGAGAGGAAPGGAPPM